jgi:hypothetical protein
MHTPEDVLRRKGFQELKIRRDLENFTGINSPPHTDPDSSNAKIRLCQIRTGLKFAIPIFSTKTYEDMMPTFIKITVAYRPRPIDLVGCLQAISWAGAFRRRQNLAEEAKSCSLP